MSLVSSLANIASNVLFPALLSPNVTTAYSGLLTVVINSVCSPDQMRIQVKTSSGLKVRIFTYDLSSKEIIQCEQPDSQNIIEFNSPYSS